MSKKAPRASSARKAADAKPQRSRRQEAEKVAAEKALSREKQAAAYDKAMTLFHSGEFANAIEMLDVVIDGPNREMAHAARVHRSVCEQRLGAREVKFSSPDEHYDYAVALINSRRLRPAIDHLRNALKAMRDPDHVHYALAICHGLMGEIDSAAEHLNRAVTLAPRNRTVARNDPDFQPFASAPPIRKILYPDAAE